MALASGRSSKRRTGPARGRKKAVKKKGKVKVSPKSPQAGSAPFVQDTSWDVANQIAGRPRNHVAATTSQTAMSPVFPGDVPSRQQSALADLAVESSLTANPAILAASEAADTAAITGIVWPPEYENVLARLTALEATVEQLLPLLSPTPGIGHNNPPPLERDELDEIESDIALLKAQLPPPQQATKIASKFVRVAGRVLTWFGKHFDTAVDAAMKEGGKNAVRAAGLSALWMTFGQQLTDAATAIWHWAMTLPGIGP